MLINKTFPSDGNMAHNKDLLEFHQAVFQNKIPENLKDNSESARGTILEAPKDLFALAI